MKEHDYEIRKKTKEDTNDVDFKNQMIELAQDFKVMKKDISKDISDLNKKIETVSSSVEEIRQISDKRDENLSKQLESYGMKHDQIDSKIDTLHDNMNMMIESDKENNRSFITLEYYNAIDKGYIPVYVLQAVECRYERYLQENGDSFIANLMEEMRKLPHEPPKKKTTTRRKKTETLDTKND